MTYENWWNLFQVLSVVLVALTFAIGSLSFLMGYWTRQEKDQKAQEQRERIAELTKDTELLKNDTAKLEKEAADAKTKQAEAEKALLELQNQLRFRALTPEQRTQLLNFLKANPVGKIEIFFVASDKESAHFAKQLHDVFDEAGWNISLFTGAMIFGADVPKGLSMATKTQSNPSGAALQQGLNSIGFNVIARIAPHQERDLIDLTVGVKP